MKKIPLHWSILLGMIIGVGVGVVFTTFEAGPKFISHWVKPFGTIFINALKLIAMPLILGSLIKGVSDLKDISKLSLMGGRTIGIYLMTTIVAVMIGLVMVNTLKPGNSISESTRQELVQAYQSDAAEKQAVAQKQKDAGPLQALGGSGSR
jgi:Na+/H+-dicarboxylate symporter